MQRTKYIPKKVSAILCSDIHLREDTPECRTDDLLEAFRIKLKFLSDLQKEYDCPVLHAGDLFHHWKPSPFLISFALEHLPDNMVTVYGQHDLPQHNYELRHKSGIYALEKAGKITAIQVGSWGNDPQDKQDHSLLLPATDTRILIWHHLTYITKPFPGASGGMSAGILKKYDADLIVTGDNHIPFTEEYKGRILVNPGSLTRQTAAQIKHKPRVYLWYEENNTVQPIYLPIEPVITREHIDKTQERDTRLEAFISSLNHDWEISLSFEENLKLFQVNNNVRDSVMQIIYKAIDEE